MVREGFLDARKIITVMRRTISKKKSAHIQYIEIVDLNELKPVRLIKDKVLIALAVFMGKTRLIDNVIVAPPKD